MQGAPTLQTQTMPTTTSTVPAVPRPAHAQMLGAALVRHLPGAGTPTHSLEHMPHGLFLLWLAYMGLLAFGAQLLWQAGVWHRLMEVDPTRLTLAIVLLFIGCSLWAGKRAWVLGQQRLWLTQTDVASPANPVASWAWEFARLYPTQQSGQPGPDATVGMAVLGERVHGPHEMAWWLNGIQLKLGLLGKVIGFSILAYQLGQTDSFDPSQSAQLLKNLTGGLGIALLTTVTGLCGNILLGLQLMRLDRYADTLVADILMWQPAANKD
jgi:hypothetical protein